MARVPTLVLALLLMIICVVVLVAGLDKSIGVVVLSVGSIVLAITLLRNMAE